MDSKTWIENTLFSINGCLDPWMQRADYGVKSYTWATGGKGQYPNPALFKDYLRIWNLTPPLQPHCQHPELSSHRLSFGSLQVLQTGVTVSSHREYSQQSTWNGPVKISVRLYLPSAQSPPVGPYPSQEKKKKFRILPVACRAPPSLHPPPTLHLLTSHFSLSSYSAPAHRPLVAPSETQGPLLPQTPHCLTPLPETFCPCVHQALALSFLKRK